MLVFNNTINSHMKNIRIYMICLVLFAIQSCDGILDVAPEFSKEGSQIFKSLEDYEYALTGAYALFRQVGYYGSGGQTTSTWGNLPDMMATDLVRTSEDLANWQTQVNWTYTANEDVIRVAWLAAYSVVAQANLTLRNIEQFSSTQQKAVNRIKGQALAIRGLAHFDIFRFWAESYERNSTAFGIPYIESVDVTHKPSRLSVSASYDKMFTDLETAELLLTDIDRPVNGANTRAYLDLIGVRAILARLNLYAKDYEKAESYASSVIAEIGLANRATFPSIWNDVTSLEVIWSVAFNLGEGSPSSGLHLSSTNRNRFKPSSFLESTYDVNNDIRYTSYFATRVLGGTPRRIVSKFYGRDATPPTASNNIVNWKAIRTGEMFLIRAEARVNQPGKEDEALADLNTLRAARIENYEDENLTGQLLIDAIALERRKELLGEGHQWFDLKRTTKYISRPVADGHLVSTPLILSSDSREWTWPIPNAEVIANPNIINQQTSGY